MAHSLPVIPNDDGPAAHHAAALRALTRGEVRFGRHDRMLYSTDASIYQVEPLGVVIPAEIEEVPGIVAYCREHHLPILPRGGGTSLAGQCVNRAVVIDFSAHCRSLWFVSKQTRGCGVDAGMTIDDLNDILHPEGLFFALDPATARQANIGGCIGNNAAGTRSIRYGRMSENVEAMDVLLSTGERVSLARGAASDVDHRGINVPEQLKPEIEKERAIVRRLTDGVIDIVRRHENLIRERYPKTLRRNAGYALDMILADLDEARRRKVNALETVNLANLICGSEGTLAVTLGATLRLHPIPKATGLAVIGFSSLEDAIESVVPLLTLKPSAVELLDDLILGLAEQNAEYRQYVQLMPRPDYSEHWVPAHAKNHDTEHGLPARAKSEHRAGKAHTSRDDRTGWKPMLPSSLRAVLYVEFLSDEGRDEIEHSFAALRELMAKQCPGAAIACYTDRAAILQALKLRKAGEPLLHGIPGRRKPVGFVEDNAVPVERLSEFVREFRRILTGGTGVPPVHGRDARATIASFYAHASVGVLHVRPLLDLRDAEDRRRMEEIAIEVADLAKSLGGVMSGEHGDGRSRGPLLERFYGPELMHAFRQVKLLFDPHHLLNPGNIVEPGPIASIHESTRIAAAGGHRRDACATVGETFFDYSRVGGFDHAVELCNGAGVCRKRTGGTMCPSYMALLDERHSTRGRANALRLTISGQFTSGSMGFQPVRNENTNDPTATSEPHARAGSPCSGAPNSPNWNDPETLTTLDLCLSCKACKTECPSNVDVATYKAEYLAQSYRAARRVPLAARMLGRVDRLNRLGSAAAPLVNALMSLGPIRATMNRLLGLAPQRTLPRLARSLHRQARSFRPTVLADAPAVILYGDCFTTYNEPHIGLAALRLLDAFGYRVILADVGCCGRAMISTGLLPEAQRTIANTAARLASLVDQHDARAILVCEPSCLASIHDEWQMLHFAPGQRPGDSERAPNEGASGQSDVQTPGHWPGANWSAWLVEDFLERFWDDHPRRPTWRSNRERNDGRILLHGHCHQKALWGVDTSAALLRRLVGPRLNILDSGCCGMAGAFGYAAHRYDLSMRIGDLVLFPAARAMGEGDILVAPGTSCRHQVRDGTGIEALHPVELVERWIGE